MAGDINSTVIGVFPNHDRANGAIDELRRNKFRYDRIRIVERGTGNFFDNLKGMFTGQTAVTSNTTDVLIKMGMPEYEAQHYQQELDANRVLLLMNADDRPEEAFKILRQNGAFDINSRLRTTISEDLAETRNPNGSQETSNPQAPLATARPAGPAPILQPNTPPEVYPSDVPPSTSRPDTSSSRSDSDVPVETPRRS